LFPKTMRISNQALASGNQAIADTKHFSEILPATKLKEQQP
jgi:hypothetical protein